MEQVITIATFNEAGPAEALKDRFIDAGLHAELIDDTGSQAIFFMNRHPRANMIVQVQKEEYERAMPEIAVGLIDASLKSPKIDASSIKPVLP